MNIGFIGLGEIGTHIATNLVKNKFKISVYNRTVSKAKKFAVKFRCDHKESIETLCKNKNIIILCLTTNAVVESVTDKIIKHISPGSVIIDHSTIDFKFLKKFIIKQRKRKLIFLMLQ